MINRFILFSIFSTFHVYAYKPGLEITWLGTSTIHISDGETGLLFDSFITRHPLSKVASFQTLKSRGEDVNYWLDKVDPDCNIKAIFISHTHYDYVLDLIGAAKKREQAEVYGSTSAKIILDRAKKQDYQIKNAFHKISYLGKPDQCNDEKYPEIGNFSIKVLEGKHTPHTPLLGFTLFKGKINKTLNYQVL